MRMQRSRRPLIFARREIRPFVRRFVRCQECRFNFACFCRQTIAAPQRVRSNQVCMGSRAGMKWMRSARPCCNSSPLPPRADGSHAARRYFRVLPLFRPERVKHPAYTDLTRSPSSRWASSYGGTMSKSVPQFCHFVASSTGSSTDTLRVGLSTK
jgi:hypothetical protein